MPHVHANTLGQHVKRPSNLDPFASARRQSGILIGDFDGETIPMILRHRDVRGAAKDWRTFSSDAPFRVPIPSEESVRDIRQLPIESDPPAHGDFRAIVAPLFMRAARSDYVERTRTLVASALDEAARRPSFDAVAQFALPLQCRGLALLLGVPDSEAEIWTAWGEHVFKDENGLNPDKAETLNAYIERAFARADEFPPGNLFSTLLAARIGEGSLTKDQARGFANLAFAGGRDTIITSLTGALVHFAASPADLERLRENPRLVAPAVEELVRYLSPITHLGRVCPSGAVLEGAEVPPGARVSLCWASANRDESVFDQADEMVIDRNPNPHVGFGSGPHTCLGAAHARVLLRSLLLELAARVKVIELIDERPMIKRWPHYERQVGYSSALMRLELLDD
jgi:cytochrome P450